MRGGVLSQTQKKDYHKDQGFRFLFGKNKKRESVSF